MGQRPEGRSWRETSEQKGDAETAVEDLHEDGASEAEESCTEE